jgi:hypothetical protein
MQKMKDKSWNWLEWTFRIIPMPYPVASYLVFIIIYLIYWLFSTKVYWFEWHIFHNFQSLVVGTLIAYLLIGIKFLLDNTRDTFRYIDHLYEDQKISFYTNFQNRYIGSIWYHMLLILSVIVPFVVSSWNSLPYHTQEPDNLWAIGLDVYGYTLLLLILLLFSNLVWLIVNVVWSLNEIGCISKAISAKVNVFSIEMKLRPVRNFLLIFVIYYFFALTLTISTYLGPTNKFPYEIAFFSVLLFFGMVLFFVGLEAIQRIINCRVENELDILNKKMEELHMQLMDAAAKGGYSENKDEINYVSSNLEVFRKEKDSLIQINRRAYDLTAIGTFIGSFLIPLVTLLENIRQLTIMK